MKSQISIKKLVLVALFLGAIGLINARTTAVPGPRDEIKIPSSSCQFEGQRTSLSKIIDDNSGRGNLELNLATGVYLVKFINLDDNKTVTKKLVVL